MDSEKRMNVVIIGAGNIGRGFVAELFFRSGFAITFVDNNEQLINEINNKKLYNIFFTDAGGKDNFIQVNNVKALFSSDKKSVNAAIANADVLVTAVGANIIPFIAPQIADGITHRFKGGNFTPLNILICENLFGADKILFDAVFLSINGNDRPLFNEKIGFIRTSVGRMVPTNARRTENSDILDIYTEKYSLLPVDKDAVKGEFPEVHGIVPVGNFQFYVEQKLYIHNLGHAAAAYLGNVLCGYGFIWQAIANPYIELLTRRVMQNSALALFAEYKRPYAELSVAMLNIDNLITRFGNKSLGDTTARVGADKKRKLKPDDRLAGAYAVQKKHGFDTTPLLLTVACAVNFDEQLFASTDVEEVLTAADSIDSFTGGDLKEIKRLDKFIKGKKSIEFICGNLR